jgi:putative PEP-CTERM system TPR-repeat lipoprotein
MSHNNQDDHAVTNRNYALLTQGAPMRTLILSLALLALAACGGGEKSTEHHLARAKEYIAADDTAAATIELQNALQLDGDSAEARWLLGKIYLEADEILAAEKEFQRAQTLGWTADDIRPGLSKTLLSQGKFKEVLQLEYADLSPSAASQLLANQALAALSEGEKESPLKLAALAREKDPQALEAKLAEATVTVHLRDPQGALELADSILASAPDNSEAYWLKGQALTRLGKLEDARAALDQSVTLADTTLTYRIARALINLQRQDYDAAQIDATELLELAPRNPAANYVQGILYFHAREYRKATTPLSLAEPVANQFPMTLFFLGAAYLVEKDLRLAEDYASRFVASQPNDSNGRKLLAVILMQSGKYKEAKSTLQPVLDNNQNDLPALNILANTLLLDDQAELGLVIYARIKNLLPDWPITPLHMEAALVTGDPEAAGSPAADAENIVDAGSEEAAAGHTDPNANFPQTEILQILDLLQKKDFQAAIEVGKSFQFRALESLAPYHLLATIYLAAGQPENAKAELQKALQQSPGDQIANQGLAQLALDEHNPAAARKHYQNILDLHPDDLTTVLQIAALDAKENKPEAMLAQLNAAIAAHPGALEPRLWLASHYIGAGNPEKVEPTFATLTELQRQSPRVLELTGMAQLALRNTEGALQTLQRLVKARPSSPDAHYLLAMAANAAGDPEQTRQQLKEAVERNPKHVPSLVGLAKIARIDGDQEVFEEKLATLLEIAPDAPDVLRLRALSAQLQGDPTTALSLAQAAFAKAPSNESLLEVAALLKAAGKSEEAKAALLKWLTTHPDDTAVRLSLANTLEQQNDVPAAQLQYVAVLQKEPDNIAALNNLAWNSREKNPKRALEYIRKAVQLSPNLPVLLDTLAVIESLNGNHAAAQKTMQHALSIAPQDPTLRMHDAMIAAARGEKAQAITALEQLLSQHPDGFPQRAEAEALLKSLKG